MAVQSRISAARLKRRVGDTLTVLVDAHEGKAALARGAADAPEIDGVVRIANGDGLRAGQFARVLVTASDEHDLAAKRVR
jgi:ribosomal protein S12 methylthiotransferase